MQCRKPSAEECTQEAVTLVIAQDMSATQVARDLGISLDTLHRWLRAARFVTSPTAQRGTPKDERVRLRRENDQVRMERDRLKKARGIFSRMPQ